MLEACGAYNDVAEEIDVSEANILVTKASKISEGARIVRALKFLYIYYVHNHTFNKERTIFLPNYILQKNKKIVHPIMYLS